MSATFPGPSSRRSDLGCHFKFESRSDELSQRIRKIIASAALGDQPYVRIAKAAAGEVALALENGLVFGDVSLEDLITTNYHPIAGTDPVQYETRALAFYERTLPPNSGPLCGTGSRADIRDRFRSQRLCPRASAGMLQPQRKGEWAWNDVHSRNRRIMERWQALVASRNRDPAFQKVFLRHMSDGIVVPTKIFSAPIFVRDEFWGNFQLGYYY